MKIMRFPLILFWLTVLPAVYAQTRGVIEGRVINRTNASTIARGVELDIIGLSSAMSIIRTATTDSAGRFRIDQLPENQQMVIRANYKGANYHGKVSFNAAGVASVTIDVFEPTDSMKDIQVEGAHLVFEMAGDQLKAVETVSFNNKTNPPRTYINPEGSFRVSKPPGILEPPLMRATAAGSSMPLTQTALESADGKSYYSQYPLKPGVTTFEVQEVLPYTNRSYSYVGRFYQDIASLKIGVIPQDLAVSGNGLSNPEINSQKNFAVYSLPPVKAGTEVTWTLSGGTPVPAAEPREASGESSVQAVPGDIERNALIIGPLLLMGFIVVLWYAFNRKQMVSPAAADSNPRQLTDRREQLLNSIAEMDHRFETHAVGRQEFLRQRAESKRELRRISQLLKKK
jgi:hypothetical protein